VVTQAYAADDKVSRSGDFMTGTLTLQGTPPLAVPSGGAAGKVLTSDGSGNASWESPSGSSGTDWLSIVTYGAVSGGVTDCTTAIQAALTAAATSGATVYVPAGIFLVSAALTMPAGITLMGDGNGESVIKLKASTAVTEILGITANQFNYSATIRDLQILGNQANSATATHGIYLFAPSDCIIQRVRITGVSGNAITLDGSGTYLGTATKVLDSFARTCGGKGLNITQYATDTLVEGCDFGSCGGPAYYTAAIQAAFVGSIGWGSDVGLSCDTTSGEIWVSGCRFDQNLYYGIWILCPNVTISSTFAYDNSVGTGGTQPGILLDSGSANVVISGCRSVGGLNGGAQQSYGLTLNSGRTGPATVTGCDFSGNGTAGVNVVAAYAGDRIAESNGYNPAGVLGPPSVPSSTVALANPYPVSCTVYIHGGTVTVISVSGSATGLAATPAMVRVPAGATITMTYSAAPAWTWFGD
jgi:hypothetical protein